MVARHSPCDSTRLRRLVFDTASAEGQEDIERHLEICDHCRQELEALAAEPAWWSKTREHLSSGEIVPLSHAPNTPSAATNVTPRLDRPTSDPPPTDRVSNDAQDGDFDDREADEWPGLGFLTPSDELGNLGLLDGYEIREVLGRGGFGVVLKAFDPALHRFVAIKVLAANLATSGAAKRRFAREAQAAAAVMHEHVVAIHAVHEGGPVPYIVMQFIDGPSLQDRLDRDGPLEADEVARIGMQTAAGLMAAHAQGLVHRDIKPANILLENGVERVRITDFGLARAVDDASTTQSGIIAGTPQYMSPEQARGEPIDHRADLFSLGSVMYAACTGRSPFRAETTLAVLRRICDESPRPILEINPRIPAWLAEIIDVLLDKRPENRLQSGAEVSDLLSRHLAHLRQPLVVPRPAALRPVKPIERLVGRRRPVFASLAGALVVSLVAALFFDWGGLATRIGLRQAEQQPREERDRESSPSSTDEAAKAAAIELAAQQRDMTVADWTRNPIDEGLAWMSGGLDAIERLLYSRADASLAGRANPWMEIEDGLSSLEEELGLRSKPEATESSADR